MGWIDDELDVEAALEGKPEAKAFEKVLERLRALEEAHEKAESELMILFQAAVLIRKWFKELEEEE